jgi:hypothetical protein
MNQLYPCWPIITDGKEIHKEKARLRHQNLKTTELYLGRVSDSEAIRWMDILYGKQFSRKSIIFGCPPMIDNILK